MTTKDYNLLDNSNLYTKNDYKELPINQSYSLYQGNKFKKQKQKQTVK